jgi:putative Mg2+ transporter-C (MgtC) family protein
MRRKAAGLRTHATVACAAALFVSLGDVLIDRFADGGDAPLVRTDPTRILEAIVTGVSFLGAGTIILRRDRRQVEGLTTAASLLLSASLGVAVGLHQFILAVGVTLLALFLLRTLGNFEVKAMRPPREKQGTNEGE